MIDGVMMRLFVADWNETVATAWQTTTIAITTRLVARICVIRQKPAVPKGIGLSQVTMPTAMTTERSVRVPTRIQ